MELQPAALQCPYCGEQIHVLVDCSVESQEYIEDCSVCCRPIVITATAVDGEIDSLQARSGDE